MSSLWDSYVVQGRQSNHALRTKELSNAGRLGAWRRWKREKEIVRLLPMVERIARQVRWMFSASIEFGDLAQAGAVGLTKAANSYDPRKVVAGSWSPRSDFERFAFMRVRGAIIDSQKRRAYREEGNVSLQAIAEANGGWLPPSLDTDHSPLPDEMAEAEKLHRLLTDAIAALPALERRALRGQLAGQPLAVTAKGMGRSLMATRETLARARAAVGIVVRGDVA